MFKTILVPNDFSDCAMSVVMHAAALGSQLGAKVVVLHALELPIGLPPNTPIQPEKDAPPLPIADHMLAGAKRLMPAYLDAVRKTGVDVEAFYVDGRPVDAILKAAEDCGADLIVMGTHGRRGLRRLVLGSVAEAVVRQSEVPVLTVRSKWHEGCEASNCSVCIAGTAAARGMTGETDG